MRGFPGEKHVIGHSGPKRVALGLHHFTCEVGPFRRRGDHGAGSQEAGQYGQEPSGQGHGGELLECSVSDVSFEL